MTIFRTNALSKPTNHSAKAAISTVIALASFGLVSSISHAATYEIDPTHANVRFAIDHFGTSTNTGGFYNLTGTLEYDPKAKTGKVAVLIPISSLNTGNEQFDDTLKSKDFFDIDNYPAAYFESTQWHFTEQPARFAKLGQAPKNIVSQVDGNLTLNGKTHPVTLTATKFNCYLSPILKKSVCGGDFTTTIDRTNWGISKYVLMGMSKEVTLNIQIEAAKQ